MAVPRWVTGARLVVSALASPPQAQAQTEAVASIGRFAFEKGGEIPDMKVGYATWGKLNDAKSNAILLVPGTSNGRHAYDAHIGPGKIAIQAKNLRQPYGARSVGPRSR